MLTIGRNIQAEGYQGWITKRIRGFMGTLGLDEGDTIWVDETYPTLATLNSLNTFLSSAFFYGGKSFELVGLVPYLKIDTQISSKMSSLCLRAPV
jgi:hypothetical protein